MRSLSAFRMGNYAEFDGIIQCIETPEGLSNSHFLDPLPISLSILNLVSINQFKQSYNPVSFVLRRDEADALQIKFYSETEFIILDVNSRIEHPFIKAVHELQNLLTDLPLLQTGGEGITQTIHVK